MCVQHAVLTELSHRAGENHEKRRVRCPESVKQFHFKSEFKTIDGAHWYARLPSELSQEQCIHSSQEGKNTSGRGEGRV